jgi:hypothetical protein
MSKNVKYVGELDAELPSLGLEVSNGDVITVPDDFENGSFEDIVDPIPASKSTKQPVETGSPATPANAE